MAGTHIYARAQGGETPQWLSDQVGKKAIWRALESVSIHYGGGGSTSAHYQSTEEPVIRPEEFGSQIGVVKTKSGEFRGVRAFLIDGGDYVLKLLWPAVMLPKIAAAAVPASWTTELVMAGVDATDVTVSVQEQEQPQPAVAEIDDPLDALDALGLGVGAQQPTPEPAGASPKPRFALRQ